MNERVKKLQRILKENGCDGALYGPSANMQYLLDDVQYHWQRVMYNNGLSHMWREGLAGHFHKFPDSVLFVPADGEPTLFATFEKAGDFEHIKMNKEVGYFHRLADLMYPYIKNARKLALGEACYYYLVSVLEEFAPDTEYCDGEKLVFSLRVIKEPKEIDVMRKVATFTDEAMEKIVKILKPGISRADIETYMAKIGEDAGLRDVSFPPACLLVKSHSGMGLEDAKGDTILEEGMAIAFDFGYVMDGYCSDYGRSFYCGKAPEHYALGYKALQAAQLDLFDHIKPGVKMDLCRTTLEKKLDEFGEGYAKYLRGNPVSGLMGHQIGIDVHEFPWVSDFTEEVFRPGMIMCIEPKLWIPDEGYMRVEDMVLITEDGCESLSVFDRDLFELPAD